MILAFQIPKMKKRKKKKNPTKKTKPKQKKHLPPTPKQGRRMKLKYPIGFYPARPMAAEPISSSLSQASLLLRIEGAG